MNLLVTHEHLQTIRKAVVKQLQRAKQLDDEAETQRCRDVLNLIDLKESLKCNQVSQVA